LSDPLFWLYLINAVLLINHEIDSAFWHEWNQFKPFFKFLERYTDAKQAMDGFLLVHFPLLFLILYGLVEVSRTALTGLILSLVLCFGGVFAFVFHLSMMKKGRPEFRRPISMFILAATFVVSLVQGAVTVYMLAGGGR